MKTETKKIDPRKARRGLNIYYYGKGKGKTTAAIGLASRAAGAGMNVCILQFIKAKKPKAGQKRQSGEWPVSSEIIYFDAADSLLAKHVPKDPNAKKIGRIKSEQLGRGFVGILGDKKAKAEHVRAAKEGLKLAAKMIRSDKYDLIILDELVSALELKVISQKDILSLLKLKPKHLHLAYTGHDNFPQITAASDMVSEINMIKHPYYKGILAQKGIDF